MSQNQSYYWQTTRHNVYLKRSAKFHLLMALMAVLTFSTVCLAEMGPGFDANEVTMGAPTQMSAAEQPKFAKADVLDAATNEIPTSEANTDVKSKAGFIDAFTASISVILFTELGDKTFFIAAIMAMRHPRLVVFAGAIFALALMTVLSVVFGMAATIIPKVYTYYISTALFAIFGLKMIYDGYVMKPGDAQEELEEVQSDLRKREDELLRSVHSNLEDSDSKRKNSNFDHEADEAGEISSAGAATSATILPTAAAATSNGAVMNHRQRKQLNHNNNIITANVGDNKNGYVLNNFDEAESKETDAFLNGGGSANLKMSTFHSSPALVATATNSVTKCDEQLSVNKTTNRKGTNNNDDDYDAGVNQHKNGTCVIITPMVHSTSAAAALGNHNGNTNNCSNISTSRNMLLGSLPNGTGGAQVPTILPANGTQNGDLSSTAGQSNGELKQVGGSKKRLERVVSAPLMQDPESGVVRKNTKKSAAYLTTRILMQAFTMTFLAEWGDRSQLTTIILAASKDVYGVTVGGILGHSICTGLAVIGGRMVATKISVRTVTIVGGIVFLGFALYALICRPDDL